MTQEKIAKELGTTKGTISKWENGLLEPDIEKIKHIARYFEVSTDYLLDTDNYDYNFEYEHNGTKLIHKERNNKK